MAFQERLQQLLVHFSDPSLDEVLVNGTRAVIEVRGKHSTCLAPFISQSDDLLDWVFELAESHEVRLDAVIPMAGGVLRGGGYRWHVVLPPVSHSDVIVSLRRQRFSSLTLADFQDPQGLVPDVIDHVRLGAPLIVCGLPGAGKSSFLSCVSAALFMRQRLAILEAIPELSLLSPSWIQLCARAPKLDGNGEVSIHRLYLEALRLRPDRLLIGEMRSDEIIVFEQALDSFDEGALTTLHAGSLKQAKQRYDALLSRYASKQGTRDSIGFCLLERGNPPLVKDFNA